MAISKWKGAMSRRRLLASAWGAGALTVLGGIARPYLSRAADRPRITHGIQSATSRSTAASCGRGPTGRR